MTEQFFTGNRAAAEAARLARAQVVAAYPVTPQTSTVEYISQFVNNGEMEASIIRVESEHSALSAVVGASLVGARTFTASSSQGLQLMSEVLYFASGMRVPAVMCIANRTLSMPVNIWADHQDSMVNRDSGWIQIYAANAQEVFDNILQAYKICEDEKVLLPAMVCYDGFIVSHVAERMDVLTQEQADMFLPELNGSNRPLLDPKEPLQFGEVVYPDWYPDFEYKKHKALLESRKTMEDVAREYNELFDRPYGLVENHMVEDADIVFVGLGSLTSTTQWTVNELRENGESAGLLKIRVFRPFPDKEIIEVCRNAKVVAVIDRDIGYGTAGMLFPDVTRALYPLDERPKCLNFIVGLGGKDITPETIMKIHKIAEKALRGEEVETVNWPDARIYD
ncbi:MAG: pyruvate ferredoxin oxidoreductase [Methanomassiliicoccales archaeon]|nr:MAG: pyruvate ferredoxin oxidoreductase [Methanomassiliicoccales archaeon]